MTDMQKMLELATHIGKEKAAWPHDFGGKVGIFFTDDELKLLLTALAAATPLPGTEMREALRFCRDFKITDGNGVEVAEDSLHEIRKIAGRALSPAGQTGTDSSFDRTVAPDRLEELEANARAYEAIIGELSYQQVADRFQYIRSVLANNIDRCEDLLHDFKGDTFDKSSGSVLGVIAVTEQILASLAGLMADDACTVTRPECK